MYTLYVVRRPVLIEKMYFPVETSFVIEYNNRCFFIRCETSILGLVIGR